MIKYIVEYRDTRNPGQEYKETFGTLPEARCFAAGLRAGGDYCTNIRVSARSSMLNK